MIIAELNVDQTVQLVSDQYEVALNGSEAFVNRAGLNTSTVETGLLDDDLVEHFITNIATGIVDEVELHVTTVDQKCVVRGRDAAAYAIESTFYINYSVTEAQQSEQQTAALPGFPHLPRIPGVTVPLVKFGFWTASAIAQDLCKRAGLSCSYGAPDYHMREDFVVNGSVASALQTLVEPFNHFEPRKIDIWTEGQTVMIRSRGVAGGGIELDAHDTRVTDLMIRARFLGFVRVVRLIGSASGSHVGGGVAVTGFSDAETVDEMEADGVVVSRIVTREHKRDIDGAVLNQLIETWAFDSEAGSQAEGALTLVSIKETISDWDSPVVVFPNQLLNRPKENQRVIEESALDSDGQMKPSNKTTISHSYDGDGYLTAQMTRKEDFDPDTGQYTLSEQQTKQYRRSTSSQYQITSTEFGPDGTPGSTRRTTVNGTPPGGPGGAQPRNVAAESSQPITYATIISTAIGAKDVTIQNRNLLLPHLQIIAAQAAFASGATEVEINFTAAGIPWLHRGQFLQLTGLQDEFGYDIPLQTALVTESKIEYRESTSAPTYLTHVKACWWEK
jgi:hypothetical protein